MCGRYYLDDEIKNERLAEQMKQAIQISTRICANMKTSGEIRPTDIAPVLAPSRISRRIGAFPKGKKTCEYCIYSDVCGFDRKMPGCEIKDVPKMSVSDVLLKIDEKHGISHSDEGKNEPEKGEKA